MSIKTNCIPGLLLHGHDLEDLVLEVVAQNVDYLELLDGKGVHVDLLQGGDLSVLDETAELGDGHPFLLLLSTSSGAKTRTR